MANAIWPYKYLTKHRRANTSACESRINSFGFPFSTTSGVRNFVPTPSATTAIELIPVVVFFVMTIVESTVWPPRQLAK